VKFQVILIGYTLSLCCISQSFCSQCCNYFDTDDYSAGGYLACLQIWFVEVCIVISLICAITLRGMGLPRDFLIILLWKCFLGKTAIII